MLCIFMRDMKSISWHALYVGNMYAYKKVQTKMVKYCFINVTYCLSGITNYIAWISLTAKISYQTED